LSCDNLVADTIVTLGWSPNRIVTLKCLGNSNFEVLSAENTCFLPGDRFVVPYMQKGCPLFIPRILRAGTFTPAYIAGYDDGLTLLRVEEDR
jgi:hypothetical protein